MRKARSVGCGCAAMLGMISWMLYVPCRVRLSSTSLAIGTMSDACASGDPTLHKAALAMIGVEGGVFAKSPQPMRLSDDSHNDHAGQQSSLRKVDCAEIVRHG